VARDPDQNELEQLRGRAGTLHSRSKAELTPIGTAVTRALRIIHRREDEAVRHSSGYKRHLRTQEDEMKSTQDKRAGLDKYAAEMVRTLRDIEGR
jgi:hypothetical protein